MGFSLRRLLPRHALLSVAAWLGFALIFWWAGWLAARHFSPNRLAAWLWLMAFAAIAGLPIFTFVEARFKALVVLLWLLHFFVEDSPIGRDASPRRPGRDASPRRPLGLRGRFGETSLPAQAALVIALALASLVKFNVLVDTAMVLACITLDDIFRRRRFPWLAPLFAAAVLGFWVAARQPLSGLAPFLRTVPLLTSGYTEAVMLTGPDALLDAVCFLLAAAMVCALAGYATWVRHRLPGIFALLGFAFLLFTAFKHGNVRHDFHEAAATLDLSLLSLAALAAAWPLRNSLVGTRSNASLNKSDAVARVPAIVCLLPTALVLLFTAVVFGRYFDRGLPAHLLETFTPRNLLGPAKPLLDPAYLPKGYEGYLADLRDSTPLPPIQGTVDTYPGNASALLAWGYDYHPRPVMQSLVAYTPQLEELNAAFLRGESLVR